MKRLSTILTALAMLLLCLFLLPTEAEAATEGPLSYIITAYGDGIIITDCDESVSGELVIPSTIRGLPVVEISDGAFINCELVESVVIPEGVTKIGDFAFGTSYNDCALRKVSLPSTLTQVGEQAFYQCYDLKEVHIADLASYLNIDWNTKRFLSGLHGDLYLNGQKVTDLIIPSGITKIRSAAFACYTSITSVTLPNSVTSIGNNAFFGCSNLKKINLNNVSVIEGSILANCQNVEITLPNHYIDFYADAFGNAPVFICSEDNHYYSKDEHGSIYNKDKTVLYILNATKADNTYIIPSSVTRLNPGITITFGHLLYTGSEEQWNAIDLGGNRFTNVTYNYAEGNEYHSLRTRVLQEATCKAAGSSSTSCAICGYTKIETIAKLVTHDWSEAIPLNDKSNAYLCITCGKVKVEGVVSVENQAEHFQEDTTIQVLVIDETYADAHKTVSGALKDHHKYVAYDITAIAHDRYVQPDGTIEIHIAIPEDFDLETLNISYISEDGKLENIPCTIDKKNRIAKFKTDHFSYYALTTEATVIPSEFKFPEIPLPVIMVIACVLCSCVTAGVTAVVILKKKK